tara:strand:+ start:14751 stop:15239 length:489 start_codon:yes stop_codon:yes gene_type:complete
VSYKQLPSVEYLKECFDYNPDTGDLIRRSTGAIVNVNKDGYRAVKIGGTMYQAHRVCWKMHYGECPSDQIDHINQDRGDNRIANLRVVSHQENGKNQKQSTRNTSGVTGVHWHTRDQRWRAKINIKGKSVFLGSFTDKIDAIYARYYAEQDYGFHENHGRAV